MSLYSDTRKEMFILEGCLSQVDFGKSLISTFTFWLMFRMPQLGR